MPDYVIRITTNRAETPTTTERLVRAKNESSALKHVVTDTVAVDRASTDDVIRLTQAGVKLETAE